MNVQTTARSQDALTPVKAADIMEAVIARGDIAQLSADERAKYYVRVCESIGLNPMTRPFEYITLNGKLTLYARKDCTDQLRSLYNVSVTDLAESERDGVFIVTARVINGAGRTDMAKGAVTIGGLKGDVLANALMKAETKAKRRATLSLCGLGFLDETEIETIPQSGGQVAPSLPKKDAKPIYVKLQAEMDAIATAAELAEWGKLAAERITVLPDDWRDIMRARFKERLLELRQREATAMAAPSDQITWEDPPELSSGSTVRSDTAGASESPQKAPAPQLPSEGHAVGAQEGQSSNADARHPSSSAAQMAAMDQRTISERAMAARPNLHAIDPDLDAPTFLRRHKPEYAQYLKDLEDAASGCETSDEFFEVCRTMPIPHQSLTQEAAAIMSKHYERIGAQP